MSEQYNIPTSLGAAGLPTEADAQNRFKGFYDEAILDSEQSVNTFVETYNDLYGRMVHAGATRLSVRGVVNTQLLSRLEKTGIAVEAAMPLAQPYENFTIAYMGCNLPERVMSPAFSYYSLATLHQVMASTPLERNPMLHLTKQNITPGFVDAGTTTAVRQSLVGQFTKLYEPFGYTREDTEAVLCSPYNTIAYAQADSGEIVSTAMAERGTVAVTGLGKIAITEITEAATASEYTEKGLYQAISALLIERVAEFSGQHIVYGESNLAMNGVLMAARQNGRRFARSDRKYYGVTNPMFGILPQAYHINDGVEMRPYNDLAVSYVPPEGEIR